MSNFESLVDQVKSFSRFQDRSGGSKSKLKQELVDLASELRAEDVLYEFEYFRPDQADFRLRSTDNPSDDAPEKSIYFLEPGRRLFLKMEGLSDEVFDGLCAELTILGENEEMKGDTSREPELNLLMPRTFQAELYAEFQRWERHESPFYIVVVRSGENADWKSSAKELKHIGKRRDIIGYLNSELIVGVFPSRDVDDSFVEKITERIQLRYEEKRHELEIFHVPSDLSDWTDIQRNISESKTFEESDFIGNERIES